MEKKFFLIFSVLTILAVLVALINWKIVQIPELKLCYVTFFTGIAGLYFLFKSQSVKIELGLKKLLCLSTLATILWYWPISKLFAKKIGIPFVEASLWSFCLGTLILISVIVFISVELSNRDRLGHLRWKNISRKQFAYSILAGISFTTAIIFSVIAFYETDSIDVELNYITNTINIVAVVYILLGIFSTRKIGLRALLYSRVFFIQTNI